MCGMYGYGASKVTTLWRFINQFININKYKSKQTTNQPHLLAIVQSRRLFLNE